PVLYDWRLRECDYGQRNGMPAAELYAGRREHLDQAYPGGESWRQAVTRVGRFLGDLPLRWNGQRILVIDHVATRWGLDHFLGGLPLEDLIEEDFAWQEGWEYQLGCRSAFLTHYLRRDRDRVGHGVPLAAACGQRAGEMALPLLHR